ncbi:hypothetical protein EYF80_053917 [Liparis tanakae]|uniref:Uncharacterized protein n=1 Tax=Liparis tanakae TaxID=230148 RepID=A0A4Z2F4Y2_9TELE|nr:hypothetical protein EYF80_053917 [Liparis tanakae]
MENDRLRIGITPRRKDRSDAGPQVDEQPNRTALWMRRRVYLSNLTYLTAVTEGTGTKRQSSSVDCWQPSLREGERSSEIQQDLLLCTGKRRCSEVFC